MSFLQLCAENEGQVASYNKAASNAVCVDARFEYAFLCDDQTDKIADTLVTLATQNPERFSALLKDKFMSTLELEERSELYETLDSKLNQVPGNMKGKKGFKECIEMVEKITKHYDPMSIEMVNMSLESHHGF